MGSGISRSSRSLLVSLVASVAAGSIGLACVGDDPASSSSPPGTDASSPVDAGSSTDTGVDPSSDAGDSDADAAPACPPSVDLMTDDKNCGTCGHDCLGGACAAGACQPKFVEDSMPTFTAAEPGSTGYVYWSDYLAGANGKIRRMPKDFSAAPVTIATGDRPTGIALTPNLVYWTEYAGGVGSKVHFSNKDGSNANTTGSSFKGPWWIAADATDVYFVNRDDTIEIVTGAIGSTTTSNVFLSGGQVMGAVSITVDASHLFVGTVANGLFRFDKNGLNKVTLAPSVVGYAVDGNQLYLTHDKGLFRIGTDGTCPTPATDCQIATGADATGSVAVDASHVYWITTDPTNGTAVHRADKTGQNPITLYVRAADTAPGNLVLDDEAIYWAVQSAGSNVGRLYKLAK